MNKINTFQASFAMAALLAWPLAQADTMAKADYEAGKSRISADFKADNSACASRNDNAKDICLAEAAGKERVALAQLEFGYTAKASDRDKLLTAKAESAHAVAMEKCDDRSGNAKNVCVKEAQAVEVKALADAKMSKEIGEARKDAAKDKGDAEYQVAIEKCSALAGNAKGSCIDAAKTRFGKS